MERDNLSSKKLKNKIQSVRLVSILGVISTIRSSNPELKTARGRGNAGLRHWARKQRMEKREGSSHRNTFQLYLKPSEEDFKYRQLTTAFQAVMLNPSNFEYVMVLHKRAYCISHSHSPKLVLLNNARNKITGKWPRKCM